MSHEKANVPLSVLQDSRRQYSARIGVSHVNAVSKACPASLPEVSPSPGSGGVWLVVSHQSGFTTFLFASRYTFSKPDKNRLRHRRSRAGAGDVAY
jgi:hypothetical protein